MNLYLVSQTFLPYRQCGYSPASYRSRPHCSLEAYPGAVLLSARPPVISQNHIAPLPTCFLPLSDHRWLSRPQYTALVTSSALLGLFFAAWDTNGCIRGMTVSLKIAMFARGSVQTQYDRSHPCGPHALLYIRAQTWTTNQHSLMDQTREGMPNSGAAVMKSMALLVVSDLAAGPIVAARGVEYRFSAWIS